MHFPEIPGPHRLSMPIQATRFEVLNPPTDFEQPEEVAEYFSLTATASTRLGRRSPHNDEFTAPMVLQRLRYPFILCEVTVTADFQMDWDQAGLVIFTGGPPSQTESLSPAYRSLRAATGVMNPRWNRSPCKWARVGLEMTAGELGVSTVVAHPTCGLDWASTPAFGLVSPDQTADMSMPSIRLKLERVGADLWVWYMIPAVQFRNGTTVPTPEAVSRRWRKCREIVSFFDEESAKGDAWVGCYASRPVEADMLDIHNDGLFVEFEDLDIL